MQLPRNLIQLGFNIIESAGYEEYPIVAFEYLGDYDFQFKQHSGQWMPVNLKKAIENSRANGNYFTKMSRAIDYALDTAEIRGYKPALNLPFNVDSFDLKPGNYYRLSSELISKTTGKVVTKQLHIILYRMDSGNYELVHYIN